MTEPENELINETQDPRPNEDWSDIAAKADNIHARDPHLEGAALPLTDLGNSQRLRLYLHNDLRWVREFEIWRVWDGKRWTEADIGYLSSLLHTLPGHIIQEAQYAGEAEAHQRWARDSSFDARLSAAIKQARGETGLHASDAEFDVQHLFNTVNCTIELEGGLQWRAHDRKDFITRMCPTPYDPNAQSDILDNTLERFLPDPEERSYVIRCLAVATFAKSNESRKLVILIGPSSTGKSTIMDLTMRTLGRDYSTAANTSVLRGNMDERPRPDVLRALDSWLIALFEASNNWELHSDQVKRITGGDLITVRTLYSSKYIERQMRGTPLIIANDVPHIKGADDAVRRRLLALIMDAPAAGEDQGQMRRKLVNNEEARRAWLALLLRTYVDCSGRYPENVPHRFAEKTMDIFHQLDDVSQIMDDLIEDGTLVRADVTVPFRNCVTVSQVWRCYHEWLRKNGSGQMRSDQMRSPIVFGHKLRELGYETMRVNGTRLSGWTLGTTATAFVARNS